MHPKKKTDEAAVAVHQLEDIMADILGWLCVEEIMGKRRVCEKWKEAARKTMIPLRDFGVNSLNEYNAMRIMTTEMPNLQQITLYDDLNQIRGHKYSDGEDPDEDYADRTTDYTTYDIGIISNFNKLKILTIDGIPGLNGRYPALFNFPLLQRLSIKYSAYLKFDLDMLAGLPILRELDCCYNRYMTGNINSLRVLKDTLEKVIIASCSRVVGNFIDLADFPQLKELELEDTAVTGDIRDIGDNHFPSLEKLILSKGVYGGSGYEFQHISDAPDLVRTIQTFKKQRPTMKMGYWCAELSKDSPDWYSYDETRRTPPFFIQFVEVGSRLGYRWYGNLGNVCEINWLDPEPDRDSSENAKYTEKLQLFKRQSRNSLYRGFHQPPTEGEYIRLCEG